MIGTDGLLHASPNYLPRTIYDTCSKQSLLSVKTVGERAALQSMR